MELLSASNISTPPRSSSNSNNSNSNVVPFCFASPPPSSPPFPITPLEHHHQHHQHHPHHWTHPSPVPRRLLELTPDPAFATTPVEGSTPGGSHHVNSSGKRGRPRADHINRLIVQGSSSPSEIKCRVCNRVFPREKSLQAHMRTHTGEKPYVCNYPNCHRAFTQSGQLKTHQRLHAGEKPFVCSAPGCTNRYTHANRTCPLHPYDKPQRTSELVLQPSLSAAEGDSEEVRRWLENYRRERLEKQASNTPLKNENVMGNEVSTPELKPKSKRALVSAMEQENLPQQQQQQQQQQQPYPHHISPRRLAGLTARPLEAQITTSSPVLNSTSQTQFPVIRSPLRRCLLPRSPVRFNSPVRRSILEERLVMSSPVARRVTLDDTNESNSPPKSSPKSSPKYSPKSSPMRRRKTPLSPRFPKKRWLKEAYYQRNNSETLAEPIRWNEESEQNSVSHKNEKPRPPRSLFVAAAALVELRGERQHQQNLDQPLNLSLSVADKS